jgi:hypothetical protein
MIAALRFLPMVYRAAGFAMLEVVTAFFSKDADVAISLPCQDVHRRGAVRQTVCPGSCFG